MTPLEELARRYAEVESTAVVVREIDLRSPACAPLGPEARDALEVARRKREPKP